MGEKTTNKGQPLLFDNHDCHCRLFPPWSTSFHITMSFPTSASFPVSGQVNHGTGVFCPHSKWNMHLLQYWTVNFKHPIILTKIKQFLLIVCIQKLQLQQGVAIGASSKSNQRSTIPKLYFNFKADIIDISILRVGHMTACVSKGSLVVMNPRRISDQQTVSLSLTELFSIFRLFSFSQHCLCSEQVSSKKKKL